MIASTISVPIGARLEKVVVGGTTSSRADKGLSFTTALAAEVFYVGDQSIFGSPQNHAPIAKQKPAS